jgi:hypothetical protein
VGQHYNSLLDEDPILLRLVLCQNSSLFVVDHLIFSLASHFQNLNCVTVDILVFLYIPWGINHILIRIHNAHTLLLIQCLMNTFHVVFISSVFLRSYFILYILVHPDLMISLVFILNSLSRLTRPIGAYVG